MNFHISSRSKLIFVKIIYRFRINPAYNRSKVACMQKKFKSLIEITELLEGFCFSLVLIIPTAPRDCCCVEDYIKNYFLNWLI